MRRKTLFSDTGSVFFQLGHIQDLNLDDFCYLLPLTSSCLAQTRQAFVWLISKIPSRVSWGLFGCWVMKNHEFIV